MTVQSSTCHVEDLGAIFGRNRNGRFLEFFPKYIPSWNFEVIDLFISEIITVTCFIWEIEISAETDSKKDMKLKSVTYPFS